MSERYKFVDMNETGPGAVRTAFANQVAYCRAAEAPITARIVAAVATPVSYTHLDVYKRQVSTLS